ncbi:unnamed protein product [Sphagnum troendelagicum]|uniref:DUS-like FMN-binding domain-containing protein n=1 Tax=Sphagnum jensenii TaxID=128206 RepID=A0ABP0VVC1_9BRYO
MELQYRGKHILAPMVRVGTFPFRMLAAEYGADITYAEEIVNHRLLRCTRKINKMLGTVDLVEKSTDTFVVQTCDEEKSCGVFQIRTSDESFSISGGIGAAFLSKPDLILDIEKTGVAAVAVNGRKVADSPRDPAQWDGIAEVVSALSIPVISNGDVFEYSDYQCIKDASGRFLL